MDRLEELHARMNELLRRLNAVRGEEAVDAAVALLKELRDEREFQAMIRVAEAVSRIHSNPTARRGYGQALIETGRVTAAIDVLRTLLGTLPDNHPEAREAAGLLGRAYKQIFFESRNRAFPAVRNALNQAIEAYRRPYEADRTNTWHGGNLLALLANAQRLGIEVADRRDTKMLANELLATLAGLPEDEWRQATRAEAHLALDDWDAVERALHGYVTSPRVRGFHVHSTLRQFTEIWDLDGDERGRQIVNILRARALQLPGGSMEVSRDELLSLTRQSAPPEAQLEAILGSEGAKTFSWWKRGLETAQSVAVIRQRNGSRLGTGFAVRAGDVGLEPAEELLVITNFHVVNPNGASPGIAPEHAEIVFEGSDRERVFQVDKLLWMSPPEQCDAAILRPGTPLTNVAPLPIAKRLPTLQPQARVYIIGHPGGRELAFSLQDNELLDHEGPPEGKPGIPGVCRIHYRAPTEGGSSGSPVFDASSWEVIALHHKGGKFGMPRLNGTTGTYAANEGIWIHSIVAAILSSGVPAHATQPR